MEFVSKEEVREKMNDWGKRKVPFLVGIDFELKKGFIIREPLNNNDILFSLPSIADSVSSFNPAAISLTYIAQTKEEYKKKFNTVFKALKRGDSFLTNLTVKTPVYSSLSLEEIFHISKAPYKICIPQQFVCFSPERFIYMNDGKISTNPMKGTIDASLPDAEKTILNDFKETAEHSTIVDLLRNDLSMIAKNVRVERFRYIDRIRTKSKEILQVSSEITGTLPENYLEQLGNLFFQLLPAGSISGAPKDSTIQIIRKAEKEERGFYTGVFGYFDGASFDSAVMIRFIEQQADSMYYRSGGGITVYSDCDAEYQETLDKIYIPL